MANELVSLVTRILTPKIIVLARAQERKGMPRKVSHILALLTNSALAGLSLCLLTEPAGATAGHACSAALMSGSRAAFEQFLKEYPLAGDACLARARTSQGFAFGNAGGGHGSSNGSGETGAHGPGSGYGSNVSSALSNGNAGNFGKGGSGAHGPSNGAGIGGNGPGNRRSHSTAS